MKILLFYAAICCSMLAACQSNNKTANNGTAADDDDKSQTEKKISKRDYSINKSNSSSDLFLDSMTMEKFFIDKKVDEKVIRRMRSFYNTRNYQFAWFSSDGLTEQALAFW